MKKMKKMSKRGLALLMSLLMCISMLNLTAFADEGDSTPAIGQHVQATCPTCDGAGEVAETVDMGPYQAALDAFVPMAIADNSQSTPANALACLQAQGVDTTDSFASQYAAFMVKYGDNRWSYDQIVNHGSYYNIVLMYEGDGTEESALANLEKYCPVAPVKTAGTVPCETCNGTGKLESTCTGEFVGGLTAVAEDGTGTMTYTCSGCGASYEEGISADEVKSILNANVTISTPTISESTPSGKKATVKVEVANSSAVPLEVTLSFALTNLTDSSRTISVNVPAGETGVASFEAIVSGAATETYSATLESASIGTLPANATASSQVSKYKTATKLVLYGANMGNWYKSQDPNTAGDPKNSGSLAWLEGKNATFAEMMTLDYDPRFWGAEVTNKGSNQTWKCVGFFPSSKIDYSNFLINDMSANYVFGKDFPHQGLSAAQQCVIENGGVFYGAELTQDILKKWDEVDNLRSLVVVWYIPDVELDIDVNATPKPIHKVIAPSHKDNSPGVTSKCVEFIASSDFVHDPYYRAVVEITIGKDAPNDVHINLDSAWDEIVTKINTSNTNFQPGDRIILSIRVNNESGKEYNYNKGSAFIATLDNSPLGVGDKDYIIGFDGNVVPIQGTDEFSFTARRVLNGPLKWLLNKDDGEPTDEEVGKALLDLGYGVNDEDQSPVTIVKKYLGAFYLSWTNAARKTKDPDSKLAESFEDLDAKELAVFTDGTNMTKVTEVDKSVLEGLYYFYFGQALTFNGQSIYDHMKEKQDIDNNEKDTSIIDTGIAGAVSGTPFELTETLLKGLEVGNGFQRTQFGFRLEFDLTAVPENTPTPPPVIILPTPTPTPTATATPTPTPEPTEEPSPTPEPSDEPIPDPDVPLGTPKPDATPTPEPSDEPIPDPDVPLGTPKPEEPTPTPVPTTNPTPVPDEEIPDPDVPLANTPKTGDETNVWFLLTVLSAAGLVFIGASEWKKRKGDHKA